MDSPAARVSRTSLHALVTAAAISTMACGARTQAPLASPGIAAAEALARTQARWTKLDTPTFKGKQDDVFFLTPELGWYVNGAGNIFKSTDGGKTWLLKRSQPGTYFRAIGFTSETHGFAGNIGRDYFPGVTDDTPLYETFDGGDTWAPAKGVTLPKGAGVCAIDVVRDTFVNAGKLARRTVVHVGGRVGGPAWLLRSVDDGGSWSAIDLGDKAAMVLDVKFFDASTGVVAAGSNREVERSRAEILRTEDGGATWSKVYQSERNYEIAWKVSFPTRDVGYATVQSYDEGPQATQQRVAKSVDGGRTWVELPLVDDREQREFGVGFASADVGWVGVMKGGYETLDGGKTWTHVEMGKAVNKIRIVPTPTGFVGYSIGTDVYKLDARAP